MKDILNQFKEKMDCLSEALIKQRIKSCLTIPESFISIVPKSRGIVGALGAIFRDLFCSFPVMSSCRNCKLAHNSKLASCLQTGNKQRFNDSF